MTFLSPLVLLRERRELVEAAVVRVRHVVVGRPEAEREDQRRIRRCRTASKDQRIPPARLLQPRGESRRKSRRVFKFGVPAFSKSSDVSH